MRLPSLRIPARWRRVSRGQALVEFALVLPIFVLFVVIAVDFGRLFYSYIQITNAAREGANFAAGRPAETTNIENRTLLETNAQKQPGESPVVITISCEDPAGAAIACPSAVGGAGPGNTITVEVEEKFTFITPLVNNFFNNDLRMKSSATAVVRGYAASTGAPPPGSCSLPVPSFTVVITSGLSVTVDPQASTPNSGVCNISGYNWDWGDGQEESVGTSTSSSHTYAVGGSYTIKLETTNQAGAATASVLITVPAGPPVPTCAKPVANFTFSRSGAGNKTYTFTDTSTVADPVNCPILTWAWTFDDGNASNVQNPTYTYGTGGTHKATLVVTNAGGASTPVTR
jgi:PKD repeat protein